MLKRTVVFVLALSLTVACLCGCKANKQRFSKTMIDYFDTAVTIIGYETDNKVFTDNCNKAEELISKYNKLFDIYNTYPDVNNLCTVNNCAGKETVSVEQPVIDLLLLSKKYYNKTRGAVNIMFGSVLSIWHNYREEGTKDPSNAKLPQLADLQNASKHTDFSNIIIDTENSAVFITDREAMIDVGAVAKGYTVDCVCDLLKTLGCDGYAVNFGGTVKSVGNKPTGEEWSVAIENPKDTSKSIVNVFCDELAVITSGVYRRYYTVNGKDYHHIIDTNTLFPENRYLSVTVLTENCGDGDALSTALFNLDIETGKAIVSNMKNTYALWVHNDGSYEYSEGFEKYISE